MTFGSSLSEPQSVVLSFIRMDVSHLSTKTKVNKFVRYGDVQIVLLFQHPILAVGLFKLQKDNKRRF